MTHQEQIDLIFQKLDELFRARSALTKMSDSDILDRIIKVEAKLYDFGERIEALENIIARAVAREQGID